MIILYTLDDQKNTVIPKVYELCFQLHALYTSVQLKPFYLQASLAIPASVTRSMGFSCLFLDVFM